MTEQNCIPETSYSCGPGIAVHKGHQSVTILPTMPAVTKPDSARFRSIGLQTKVRLLVTNRVLFKSIFFGYTKTITYHITKRCQKDYSLTDIK